MATAIHLVEPAPNDFLAGPGKSSNRAAIQYACEPTRTAYGAQTRTAYGAQTRTAYGAQTRTAYGAQTRTAYGAQTRTAYGAPTRDALDEHYNDEQ